MRTVGHLKSARGALARGVLRVAVLLALGVIAVLFTRNEPLGNRIFLYSLAGLLLTVACWSLSETRREVTRLRRNESRSQA